MNIPRESYWLNGTSGARFTLVEVSKDTDGQYSFFDTFIPTGAGNTLHIHPIENESFYILEGELAFQRGDEVITATPGTLVHVPKGVPHYLRNLGTEPARLLISFSPAGENSFEDVVTQLGNPGSDPTPFPPPDQATIDRSIAISKQNDNVPLNSIVFTHSEYRIREDGKAIAAVTVLRPGDNSGAVSATITLEAGTAELDSDYQVTEIPVNFADQQSLQTIEIPLTNDDRIEENETINLTLSNPTNGAAIGLLQNTATLTIVDDDARAAGEQGRELSGDETINELIGGAEAEQITGNPGTDTLTGGGNQDLFVIRTGDGLDRITDFTGVGKDADPCETRQAEIDTLKFEGVGLTVENLLLTQDDRDLLINFVGVENTGVRLQNFALEELDNFRQTDGATVDIGNILFDAETGFQESFDVFDATQQQDSLSKPNTVTFLNDLDNHIRGLERSQDVINGQGGNDILNGLSGDDILRGGTGDDTLLGDLGQDILTGNSGNDRFVLNHQSGVDRILDFAVGEDHILLADGLTFSDLMLVQGTGSSANHTLIETTGSNKLLAILQGVSADRLSDQNFLVSQDNPLLSSL
jgi:quercetin dioxygenase-like cupin family protein